MEKEQDWIFTFGWNQHEGAHRHHFVPIHGTFASARDEMIKRYGRAWSMQYENEEEAGVKKYGLAEIQPDRPQD